MLKIRPGFDLLSADLSIAKAFAKVAFAMD